jgi:ankyrin repeat protein
VVLFQKRLDKKLVTASREGHPESVKALLDAGANVHSVNDLALRYASMNGHTEVVKLLLDKGADVHAENNYALIWARAYGHTETVKVLEAAVAAAVKPQVPAP